MDFICVLAVIGTVTFVLFVHSLTGISQPPHRGMTAAEHERASESWARAYAGDTTTGEVVVSVRERKKKPSRKLLSKKT